MTTLPECPRPDCTFAASEENPTGHHWHERSGRATVSITHLQDHLTGDACDSPEALEIGLSPCYSAREPDPADRAAANPATTVREDDSRVRELRARLDKAASILRAASGTWDSAAEDAIGEALTALGVE